MNYRPEIDGLRALAVLPVILFHAGFQTFSGGFVGVDVFFVISGYLITTIILTELEAGRFSIVTFYERRARRILPALFLVMLACLPFGWLWLLPHDLKEFADSLIAVSAFASNVLFWRTSGYFETATELKPLLHTWSLAVEEQYYVFFPLLLLLTWRLGKRWTLGLLAFAFVASLAAAQWGSVAKPDAAFYLLPTRGWELLVGAFLAFHFANPGSQSPARALSEAGSIIGFVLIAYAVLAFDEQTPFPSLYTLVPALGTALIILCTARGTHLGKLLGSKVFVGVGLISYSAYLWHQPLFAFARHASIDEPGGFLLGELAIASLALAYFSWKYVEKPFRDKSKVSRNGVFLFGALGSVFFVAVGTLGHVSDGFDNRLTESQRKVSDYSNYDFSATYRRYECFMEPENTYRDFSRDCSKVANRDKILLLWGDSYAAALAYGLKQFRSDVVQYTTSECPPLVDADFVGRPHCHEINEFVKREIERLQPKEIVLHANWYAYRKRDAASDIEKTMAFIRNTSPSSEVVIIGDAPQWEPTLPVYAVRKRVALDRELWLPMNGYARLSMNDARIKAVAERHGARFVSALDKSCRDQKCLAVVGYKNGFQLSAWDNGHLTEGGSVALARELWAGNLEDE